MRPQAVSGKTPTQLSLCWDAENEKIHAMRPQAMSGKTPTQLSLCWSAENGENS